MHKKRLERAIDAFTLGGTKMKKRIVAIVLAAATALSMTGCAGAVAPAPAAGSAEPAAETAASARCADRAAKQPINSLKPTNEKRTAAF